MSAEKSTNVRSTPPAPRAPGLLRGAAWAGGRLVPGLAARLEAQLFFRAPARRRRTPEEQRVLVMADFLPGRTSRPALWRWGEGPRVLLMHGWGGCAGQMTPLVEPLTAAGFSVLAVEAPGHGEAPGRQASIPAFADTIAQVARAEGPLQAVVAHSMGGAGASLAVARGLRLERAAYLGPPADALVWLRAYARWLGLDEAATLRLQARAEVVAGEPLGHLNAAWLGPRLPMPLLVVHDRQDREVPFEDGAAVASSAPRGRLVETRGLGHRRLLRDAAVGQLVARFVAGAGEAELGPVEAGAERAG